MSLFQLGKAFTVLPSRGVAHTATVIFLHGLGDTGMGWSMGMEEIRRKDVKYLCPTAPIQPVSLNFGFQMPSWFDVYGLEDGSAVDIRGIKIASEAIRGLIDDEIARGIQMDRIVLGGFSQGGALALFTYLTMASSLPSPPPLAGVAAFSTWLPTAEDHLDLDAIKSATPILQCHGTADQVVPCARGFETSKLLKQINPNLTFKEYKGMGHHSSMEEMEDLRTFLDKVIPEI